MMKEQFVVCTGKLYGTNQDGEPVLLINNQWLTVDQWRTKLTAIGKQVYQKHPSQR